MKKVLIILCLIFGLVVSSFAYDWYSYIGKKVEVTTIFNHYTGIVTYVVGMEICKNYEPLTHECIQKEVKYTMFLRLEDNTLTIIRCEAIRDIQEK